MFFFSSMYSITFTIHIVAPKKCTASNHSLMQNRRTSISTYSNVQIISHRVHSPFKHPPPTCAYHCHTTDTRQKSCAAQFFNMTFSTHKESCISLQPCEAHQQPFRVPTFCAKLRAFESPRRTLRSIYIRAYQTFRLGLLKK